MRFSQENVNEVSKQGSFSPADSSLVVSEEKPHFRESDKRDSRRNLWCQEECAVETPPPAPPPGPCTCLCHLESPCPPAPLWLSQDTWEGSGSQTVLRRGFRTAPGCAASTKVGLLLAAAARRQEPPWRRLVLRSSRVTSS